MARAAQGLLASRTNQASRQLREQGNALCWLIARRLAAQDPDLAARAARLNEIRGNSVAVLRGAAAY